MERLSRPDAADLIRPPTAGIDIARLREEIKALETRQQATSRRYAKGKLTEEQFDEINDIIDQDLADLRNQVKAATAESPLADFADTDDARATWDDMTLGRKREVVRYLLKVELTPRGRGRRRVDRTAIKITRNRRPRPADRAA